MAARQPGFKGLIVPEKNAAEAAVVEGVNILGVSSRLTTSGCLMGCVPLKPAQPVPADRDSEDRDPVDFREIKGQEYAKRVVEVAAAGGHNVLVLCPSSVKLGA